jgi:hypothetical protein
MSDGESDQTTAEALDTAQWLGMYSQMALTPFTSYRLKRAAELMDRLARERIANENPGFGGK